MIKKLLLVAVFACNTMLPSQFLKRCFDAVRPASIKELKIIATGIAAEITAMVVYKKNKNEELPFDVQNRDSMFADRGYEPINDDPRAKPIIDTILKRYAPHEPDIRVYKRIRLLEHYDKIRIDDNGNSLPNMLAASSESPYKSVFLENKHLSDAIRDNKHDYYPCAEAVMGHEIGHIVNKSGEKMFLMDKYIVPSCTLFGTIAGSMNYAIRTLHKTVSLRSAIPITAAYGFIAYNLRMINELLCSAYSRYDERRADYHVIKHASDPRVLRQVAKFFKQLDSNNSSLSVDHPSCAERAAYFEKAAQELEEKIAAEGKA